MSVLKARREFASHTEGSFEVVVHRGPDHNRKNDSVLLTISFENPRCFDVVSWKAMSPSCVLSPRTDDDINLLEIAIAGGNCELPHLAEGLRWMADQIDRGLAMSSKTEVQSTYSDEWVSNL